MNTKNYPSTLEICREREREREKERETERERKREREREREKAMVPKTLKVNCLE